MKWVLSIIIVLSLGLVSFQCGAKKLSREEQKALDTIIVTLNDGTVVNGMVKRYWTANHASRYNTEFTLTDDNEKEVTVTAENLDSIVFPLRSDSTLRVWRVFQFPSIKLFGKKGNLERWIAADLKRSEHAQVVVPNVRVNVPIGTRPNWITTTWGCLRVENDSICYPFFFDCEGGLNLKYLKKTLGKNRPELVAHIEQWFKDDKKRKKELEKNYSYILEAVEDYYNKK
ncbi:hypothetical protein [Duncaniella muris]|uniref:hypothetical protein n=1 Tax=Duncaniella muris TaxID=2094150 RepID=UPI00263BE266|nr:hypothetical protein [Duncaniella muris]